MQASAVTKRQNRLLPSMAKRQRGRARDRATQLSAPSYRACQVIRRETCEHNREHASAVQLKTERLLAEIEEEQEALKQEEHLLDHRRIKLKRDEMAEDLAFCFLLPVRLTLCVPLLRIPRDPRKKNVQTGTVLNLLLIDCRIARVVIRITAVLPLQVVRSEGER
jgi:hypothetical protein